jgi:hypothetical protein
LVGGVTPSNSEASKDAFVTDPLASFPSERAKFAKKALIWAMAATITARSLSRLVPGNVLSPWACWNPV